MIATAVSGFMLRTCDLGGSRQKHHHVRQIISTHSGGFVYCIIHTCIYQTYSKLPA